jgi:hemerythrin-like domain-containing protein
MRVPRKSYQTRPISEHYHMEPQRRRFLASAAIGLGGLGCGVLIAAPQRKAAAKRARQEPLPANTAEEESNTPPESLMLEHAVMERLLLIFDEAVRRIRGKQEVSAAVVQAAAGLVQKLAGHHEKIEEELVFPLLANRGLSELVDRLKKQHEKAGVLVSTIQSASGDDLAQACGGLVQLYRPHMARESTALFQKLYGAVTESRLEEIGDQIEERQDQTFGENGLEKLIEQVGALERQLGIYDLLP